MYSLSSIKQLHIEPTNKCNAACPMCTRTGNKVVENNLSDLSISLFKKAFSNGWVNNSTKVCNEHCKGSKVHHWIINGEVKAQR